MSDFTRRRRISYKKCAGPLCRTARVVALEFGLGSMLSPRRIASATVLKGYPSGSCAVAYMILHSLLSYCYSVSYTSAARLNRAGGGDSGTTVGPESLTIGASLVSSALWCPCPNS